MNTKTYPHKGIDMTEGTRQWMLGVIVGVVLTSLIAIGLSKMKTPEPPMHMMPRDIIQAYNMGLKDALRTNPASWDLEQTCLNMWADKQPVREP
jgi:bifunctional DNase/RNase